MVGYSVALLCLSLNVYHEAGGEPLNAKEAVADTVLLRAQETHRNVCSVIMQPHQYSWVSTRSINALQRSEWRLLARIKHNPIESRAWEQSKAVAAKVLSNGYHIKYRFDHYHTRRTHPSWARGVVETRIGNQLFSRLNDAKKKTVNANKSVSPLGKCFNHIRGWYLRSLRRGYTSSISPVVQSCAIPRPILKGKRNVKHLRH